MNEQEFKEKCRKHLFNSQLNAFPTVFEMYVRSFNVNVDRDEAMTQIISIIRTSENGSVAYEMVSHYLDSLEGYEGHSR